MTRERYQRQTGESTKPGSFDRHRGTRSGGASIAIRFALSGNGSRISDQRMLKLTSAVSMRIEADQIVGIYDIGPVEVQTGEGKGINSTRPCDHFFENEPIFLVAVPVSIKVSID